MSEKVVFTKVTIGQLVQALDGGKKKHLAYQFSGNNRFYENVPYTENALEADIQTLFGQAGFSFPITLS